MTTSFEKVYKYFLMNIEDDGMAYLDKEDFYTLLKSYLIQGSTLDFKECRKTLKYNEGERFEDKFIVRNGHKTFTLYPQHNNTIYDTTILINGIVLDECFYVITEELISGAPVFPLPDEEDTLIPPHPVEPLESEEEGEEENNQEEENNMEFETRLVRTVELLITPENDDEIVIISKEVGYFEDELTEEEILIVAQTMKLHWVRKQILREENLKSSLSTSDFKKTSNANLLDKLLMLEERTESILDNYKVNYTLEDFEGFY